MRIPSDRRSLRKGAALITVLALSALIATILPLFLSDIRLEYAESRNALNRLRAEYNARSAVELSLLRLLLYKEGQKVLEKNTGLPLVRNLLDMIWRAPVVWPPPVPEDLLESEKREIRALIKESFIRGSYLAQIQPEDGKPDVNDLSDALEPLQLFTRDILSNLLLREEEMDYTEEEALQALNNLADGTDLDRESRDGGWEETPEGFPFPDRSFIFKGEVSNMPGITEPLWTALKPHITVYGSKGLNINYTTAPLLTALGLSEELTEEILTRTRPESEFYKPFQSTKEFCEWLMKRGADVCNPLEQRYHTTEVLNFSSPFNFRIQAGGRFQSSRSRVESLVYDVNRVTARYQALLLAEKTRLQSNPEEIGRPSSAPPPATGSAKKTKPAAPPPWKVSPPLLIMYWKEGL